MIFIIKCFEIYFLDLTINIQFLPIILSLQPATYILYDIEANIYNWLYLNLVIYLIPYGMWYGTVG